MFGHIMVPLDGSARAERALSVAVRVAQATGGTLHLIRVLEEAGPLEMDRVQEDLDALRPAAVTTQTAVLTGHAAPALLAYEQEAGIDLVVLCSHGRTGLARFALGSVADRLLHHGTAPLLLVSAFGDPVRLEQAVVPLDGIERTRALAALQVVTVLAGRLLREVTLLAVIAAPEERAEAERYLASAAQRVPHDSLTVGCRVEQGDPASVILDVAGADGLVVLATHGRAGVTRWALGSVAERVTHAGAAGVLLVRAGMPHALTSLTEADVAVHA